MIAAPKQFKLRSYQREWIEAVNKDRLTHSRLLIDACGGLGKTTLFAALAKEEWEQRGGRTLVLENRDKLVRQTADRIRNETGLEVEIEMADSHASPYAPVVVASVQTLGRVNRLTGFSDTHFSLVVPDEAHRSLAPLYVRVLDYFHHGAESLAEGWIKPEDGLYTPKCHIIGTTATPDIGTKKNLGTIYQKFSVRYPYIEAIENGWLVGITQKSIPVKVDTRKFKIGRSSQGSDFSAEDMSAALVPIIEELALQVVKNASDRKTICFLPSVECARMMAAALSRHGLNASFVSGECLDVDEKTEAFARSGKGSVLCNCAIFVEGVDFPDLDCVAWFRATISRAFYLQGIYRGTRVLTGLISDDQDADERKLAIANSSKPNLLVLDPLFVSDRIDICSVHDLFTDKAEVKERMKKLEGDFIETVKEAERDFLKALEKAAKKHEHRQPRTIDPIRFSLSIGDDALAHYEPESEADARAPTTAELDFLLKHKIDSSVIKCSGQAQRIIDRIIERDRLGFCTPGQLSLMIKLGLPEDSAMMMKKGQAGAIIGKRTAHWRR